MPFMLRVRGGEPLRVGKVVAVAKNYEEHRQEMAGAAGSGAAGDVAPPEDPVLFLKPSTSLLHDGGTLRIPAGVANVHWETELAVVVGREMKDVPEAQAMEGVLGYAVLLDMTARDLQARAKRTGMPWALSKAMDGFAPVSEVVPATGVPDWRDLKLQLLVNGQVRQKGRCGDMLHPVPRLLAHVSRYMTLEPGDILATGTPAGVGAVRTGDLLRAELVGHAKVEIRIA